MSDADAAPEGLGANGGKRTRKTSTARKAAPAKKTAAASKSASKKPAAKKATTTKAAGAAKKPAAKRVAAKKPATRKKSSTATAAAASPATTSAAAAGRATETASATPVLTPSDKSAPPLVPSDKAQPPLAPSDKAQPPLVPSDKVVPGGKGGGMEAAGYSGATFASRVIGAAEGEGARRHLANISEIRTFFRTNETPIFFIGATASNLLGVDRWVRNFTYVAYFDSWNGYHPRVFSPPEIEHDQFESGEDINNYLLRHPAVREHMQSRVRVDGDRPKVLMVFFNEETERICQELGYDLILPPYALRNHLDSKITTTRLGAEAGAASVPNVLTTVSSYEELSEQAEAAGLGTDLVLQTAYGDSGKTTFFVADRESWNKAASDVVGEEIKVMKRVANNLALAVEAVNTANGTVVGPFMIDLTGYKELTPYRGGWCGNDLYPDTLTDSQRARAIEHVRRLGDRLRQEGYRGFFEVDVLIDLDTDDVYLGELNPRISGASPMTHVTAGAYADVPLFLFHLLEFLNVDHDVDTDEINARWRELAAVDVWSQLIMKTSDPTIRRIDKAPATGIYRLQPDGSLTYERNTLDWHYLHDPEEAFFLRVYGPGDYLYKGADLGVLVTKARMQTDDNELTERCHQFIKGIHALYETTEYEPEATPVHYLALMK